MAFKLLPEQPAPSSLNAESIHRLPAQAIKGAAATVPGIFGDVASLVNDFVAGPLSEKITGEKAIPYEQTSIGKILPTTQTHKSNLEEGIPYLKPKNKVEQFTNDVAQDAASLFLPGSTLAKTGLRGTSALKSLATSLGANSAGSFVSDLTGDEKKGAYTKLGTMFLFSALNKPAAEKEIGKLYQKANDLLPPKATVNAAKLEQNLDGLKERILAGRKAVDLAPSEKFVIDQADTVLRQVENGKANVGTLRAAARSLNENLQKAVYEAPDKSAKTRARTLAKEVNRSINSTLADYGKTNPEWWKYQKGANEAFGALQQSNLISNFIKNNVSSNAVSHGLLHALGVGSAAVGGIVPYHAGKIIYRIAKSPELAKHYSRVVSSAAAENAPLLNKELKILEEKLSKESKQSGRYRLLD